MKEQLLQQLRKQLEDTCPLRSSGEACKEDKGITIFPRTIGNMAEIKTVVCNFCGNQASEWTE